MDKNINIGNQKLFKLVDIEIINEKPLTEIHKKILNKTFIIEVGPEIGKSLIIKSVGSEPAHYIQTSNVTNINLNDTKLVISTLNHEYYFDIINDYFDSNYNFDIGM